MFYFGYRNSTVFSKVIERPTKDKKTNKEKYFYSFHETSISKTRAKLSVKKTMAVILSYFNIAKRIVKAANELNKIIYLFV